MKKTYYKIISKLSGIKPSVNQFDMSNAELEFNENQLETLEPKFNKFPKTYVLIRKMLFHPVIKLNLMQDFKSLLRWNELYMSYSIVFRDYPLGFDAEIKGQSQSDLALKLPAKVRKLEKSEISLTRKLRMHEEIVTILPYTRKVPRKNLFRVSLRKQPVYKSYFSREEMKFIRKKIAEQNQTIWSNIEIFEIYTNFFTSHFLNIKQIPSSKELEYTLNFSSANKTPEKNCYLVIGKRRDTKQPVKALIDPSDIESDDLN